MSNPSQLKGKRNEREALNIMKQHFPEVGWALKRTPSPERWKSTLGDINLLVNVEHILKRFFWEIKARKSGNVVRWWEKAKDDSQGLLEPVVVFKKSNQGFFALLKFETFLKLLKEIEKLKEGEYYDR